jgi:hypothetical protein
MKLALDRMLRPRVVFAAALLALAVPASGCGGDDDSKGDGKFEVSGKVDHYAGPTPLVVRLSASSKNADGDVIYRWRFDDGTTSRNPNVTHRFDRAGYYQVILDARDASGNNDRESYLFGAWPPKQWSEAQRTPLTKKGALSAQRVQQQRTDKRRAQLREELRRRAREQIEG